jgi:hypothetical protein
MKITRQITILFCLFIFQTILVAQTTYTLQISNDNWTNPDIWFPVGVPGPGDFVIIYDYSVVINSGPHSIAGFKIVGGTILFTGTDPTLTITDSAIWYDGEFDGGNGVGGGDDVNSKFIISPGAKLIIDTDATPQTHRFYEGITVINQGTITCVGSSNIGVRGLSVVQNEGLFDMQSDADFGDESFSGGYFVNTSTGVFRKSGGTDITNFNIWWIFNNEGGTIEAQSGTLKFDCNGTFTNGNYNAASGALISFSSLAQTIKGTLSGSPSGDIRLAGSTISVDSSGATLDFQGNGFQWSRGTFTGGGTLSIPNGSLLRLVTDPVNPQNQELFGGTTILNFGVIKQESNNSLSIRNNSVLDNRSLFDVTTDADFTGGTGNGGTFINTGTLRKSGGNDISSFNSWWNFQNQGGTIDAQSGSIHFIGPGTFDSGNYIASNNAAIDFRSSTQIFKGTISGSPVGAVRLSGSTINIDSSGATLDFQGTGFQFSSGVITGGGTLTIPEGSLLRLVPDPVDPTPFQSLFGGTTLLNLGTIRQESNTTVGIRDNSIVDNRSLFEILTDADFSGGTGSGGTFMNTGTFRKSGGNDVTQMNGWWKFFNQNGGVIDAASGELEFTMSDINFSNDPGAIINGAASIDVPNSFTNDGIIAPGSGIGMLLYIGNFVPSSTGVLDIQIGGLILGTEYDQLNVTGNATLNGSLKVRVANGFVPNNGDSFVILNTSGTTSSDFNSLDIQDGLYLTVVVNSNNVTLFVDSVGVLSVKEINDGEIVNDFNLYQNYPNPFNPSTNIQFALPQSGYVTLEVFSVTGERVDVLISEELNAGKYNYEWNGSNLTSGIYFYRLNAGSFVETRKMMMLK